MHPLVGESNPPLSFSPPLCILFLVSATDCVFIFGDHNLESSKMYEFKDCYNLPWNNFNKVFKFKPQNESCKWKMNLWKYKVCDWGRIGLCTWFRIGFQLLTKYRFPSRCGCCKECHNWVVDASLHIDLIQVPFSCEVPNTWNMPAVTLDKCAPIFKM